MRSPFEGFFYEILMQIRELFLKSVINYSVFLDWQNIE
jgi:hypothetical protein